MHALRYPCADPSTLRQAQGPQAQGAAKDACDHPRMLPEDEDDDLSPGPSPTRGGEQCLTCRLAGRANARRSGLMRSRSRSFDGLADSSASLWGLTERRAHS